jgi:choline kinase
VIVLAAGRGSRLGALGDDRSKWLVPVGSRRIADRQIEAIHSFAESRPDSLGSVTVVTGHAAPAVTETAAEAGLGVLHNARYLELNNWYSVLVALDTLPSDGRVVIFNGDLCARPAWFERFLEAAADTDESALIAVDLERHLTDESMKVAVHPADTGRSHLKMIGKVGVEDPVGEYVGMLAATGDALKRFTETLRSFCDSEGSAQEWYEGAVRITASEGVPWTVWPTPDSDWFEIDDEHDHAAAVALLGTT